MKKKKGYRNGGKIKGMMNGGRMKAKGMKNGGKMKAKGMKNGGKMKSKMMRRGGAKPKMTLAQLPTYTIFPLDYRGKEKLNNNIEEANALMDKIEKYKKMEC